jgi:hypothetical protein
VEKRGQDMNEYDLVKGAVERGQARGEYETVGKVG